MLTCERHQGYAHHDHNAAKRIGKQVFPIGRECRRIGLPTCPDEHPADKRIGSRCNAYQGKAPIEVA